MADKNIRKRKLYTLRWTEEKTHALIDLRIEIDSLFKQKNVVPKTLWEQLAEDLNLSKSGPECEKKWKNLIQKYKKIKEPGTGQGMSANKLNSNNWLFYSKINDFIGGKHTIAPPVLLQSIPDYEIEYLDEKPTIYPLTNTPSTNTLDDVLVTGIPSTDTPSTSRSVNKNNKKCSRSSLK